MMAITALENAFSSERSRLIRWMTKLTGDPNSADDLVQETYITAWENRHKLHDPTGVISWLNAIAHNMYKRWSRKHGKQQSNEADLLDVTQDPIAEYELERGELADLLDKALDILPPETRTILLARYLEEQPQAKVARDMGLSENAIAVRLHRGKMALRKVIDIEQQALKDDDGFQDTRIWCGACGQAQYKAKFISETGDLTLICPKCTLDPKYPAWGSTGANDLLRGMKAVRPAFKRLIMAHSELVRPALTRNHIECIRCGNLAPLHRKMPDFVPNSGSCLGIHFECPSCGIINYTALSGIAGSLPQAWRFHKENPRLHVQDPQYIHHEGRNTLMLSIKSLRKTDVLDVLFACDTYEILSVYRNGKIDNEIQNKD